MTAAAAVKLSPAQQKAWDSILNAKVECASDVRNGRCWIQRETIYCRIDNKPSFIGGRYYGHFQKATLNTLAKKGLIVLHKLSSTCQCDEFSLAA